MGERFALMVRPLRRPGPLPTGSIFLVGELADGLTRSDLSQALARDTLEITEAPAPAPKPEVEPEPEVAPEPEAPAPAPDAPEAPAADEPQA